MNNIIIIKNKVLEDSLNYADVEKFTQENSILLFSKTFLSNMYATPIQFRGKAFSSVEHAYQFAKFNDESWGNIDTFEKEEIAELLKTRGYGAHFSSVQELFFDPKFTSLHTKTIADFLRIKGYVSTKFNDEKLNIMIECLLSKFADKNLYKKLKKTDGKYLIEGNTWNDVYWGVSDGKGENMLGKCLMIIRKMEQIRL